MGSGRDSPTMSVTLRPNLNFATKADNTSVDWDELKGRLSSFQVDKLNYFFTQFFDHNQDGVIDSKDFAGLNERLRKVAGWELDDPQYLAVCDNNRVFFECLLEQAYAERNTEGLASMASRGLPQSIVVGLAMSWKTTRPPLLVWYSINFMPWARSSFDSFLK